MAQKRTGDNGRDRLEKAMAMLIQSEAAFLARLSETDRHLVETDRALLETDRRFLETDRLNSERFARIEADIATILRVLAEHSRLLERLPEAIRDKIGFKAQQ